MNLLDDLKGLTSQALEPTDIPVIMGNQQSEAIEVINFDNIDNDTKIYLLEQTEKINIAQSAIRDNLLIIGKVLTETQTKLANHRNGLFNQWINTLSIGRSHVYNIIQRYNYAINLIGDNDYIVHSVDNIIPPRLEIHEFLELPQKKQLAIAKQSKAELLPAIREAYGLNDNFGDVIEANHNLLQYPEFAKAISLFNEIIVPILQKARNIDNNFEGIKDDENTEANGFVLMAEINQNLAIQQQKENEILKEKHQENQKLLQEKKVELINSINELTKVKNELNNKEKINLSLLNKLENMKNIGTPEQPDITKTKQYMDLHEDYWNKIKLYDSQFNEYEEKIQLLEKDLEAYKKIDINKININELNTTIKNLEKEKNKILSENNLIKEIKNNIKEMNNFFSANMIPISFKSQQIKEISIDDNLINEVKNSLCIFQSWINNTAETFGIVL